MSALGITSWTTAFLFRQDGCFVCHVRLGQGASKIRPGRVCLDLVTGISALQKSDMILLSFEVALTI